MNHKLYARQKHFQNIFFFQNPFLDFRFYITSEKVLICRGQFVTNRSENQIVTNRVVKIISVWFTDLIKSESTEEVLVSMDFMTIRAQMEL